MNRQLYRQCTSVPSLNYSVQCTSVQSLNYSAVCTLYRQQWIAWEPEQGFCQRQGLVDCCMILHSSIHFMYDTNMKNWMSVSHSILADLGHSHHTLIAYCRPPYSRIWGRQCCLSNHTSSQTQVHHKSKQPLPENSSVLCCVSLFGSIALEEASSWEYFDDQLLTSKKACYMWVFRSPMWENTIKHWLHFFSRKCLQCQSQFPSCTLAALAMSTDHLSN